MNKLFTTEAIKPEQIADWKTAHKGIFQISVAGTDQGQPGEGQIHGFFRKPTLDELGMAATAGGKDNPMKTSRVLYNTCILGGHPDFENDETVILSALSQFGEIMKTRQAEIKKL